jgi:hypothetical protein
MISNVTQRLEFGRPKIIKMTKSRRMKWARHVERMGEIRSVCKILVGSLNGRDHSEHLGVDGRIILKQI